MNIDILHRPTALENLLAGRIWPAGRRLPMHGLWGINLSTGNGKYIPSDILSLVCKKLCFFSD